MLSLARYASLVSKAVILFTPDNSICFGRGCVCWTVAIPPREQREARVTTDPDAFFTISLDAIKVQVKIALFNQSFFATFVARRDDTAAIGAVTLEVLVVTLTAGAAGEPVRVERSAADVILT